MGRALARLAARMRSIGDLLLSPFRHRRRRKQRVARKAPAAYAARILSDGILFNETPSPTELECQRSAFVLRRLGEFGVAETSVDADGNVSFLHPAASDTEDCLLLLTDMDNEGYSPLGSLVKLDARRASGNGIAGNSLGAATLLVLAEYLRAEDVRLDSHLLFLFAPQRRSAEAWLRRLLEEGSSKPRAAVVVTGTELGDLETRPLGNCRLSVTVRAAERARFPTGAEGSAVSVLSNIASRLSSIQWGGDGETLLNIARMRAGVGYGYFPTEGFMDLEVYSSNAEVMRMACSAVTATIQRTASEAGAAVEIVRTSETPVSSIQASRPLVGMLQEVHRELGIRSCEAAAGPMASAVSALGLPAVTVAITKGRKTLTEEFVETAPIEIGFRQLLGFLARVSRARPGDSP